MSCFGVKVHIQHMSSIVLICLFLMSFDSIGEINCQPLEPKGGANIDSEIKGKLNGEIDGIFKKLVGVGVDLDGSYKIVQEDVLKQYEQASSLYIWERMIYLRCELLRESNLNDTNKSKEFDKLIEKAIAGPPNKQSILRNQNRLMNPLNNFLVSYEVLYPGDFDDLIKQGDNYYYEIVDGEIKKKELHEGSFWFSITAFIYRPNEDGSYSHDADLTFSADGIIGKNQKTTYVGPRMHDMETYQTYFVTKRTNKMFGIGVKNTKAHIGIKKPNMYSIYDLEGAKIEVNVHSSLPDNDLELYGLTITNPPGQEETIIFEDKQKNVRVKKGLFEFENIDAIGYFKDELKWESSHVYFQ